ncbi:conserved hypothetical protein [Desulfotalea psychrophila LSv54]|uniref:Uncharacterized protein n=1 Tax=Desulfotalea psychrophila (strain LSv54 / DSM 12343) TaxID=177439 RepID=Q6AM01_DESPS|nr:conserved hypothetical protein [Desulfotalea psychrophila LSv54]
MLIVKCAACKKKLWSYEKIGQGEVLRCHKERIQKFFYQAEPGKAEHKIYCSCGKEIGIDRGKFFKMIAKAFTYSGTKRN